MNKYFNHTAQSDVRKFIIHNDKYKTSILLYAQGFSLVTPSLIPRPSVQYTHAREEDLVNIVQRLALILKFTKATPLNLLAKVCKGVMSKANYLRSGSQYTQDNWPMRLLPPKFLLLKKICIIFTRPSTLFTGSLSVGLGMRQCDTRPFFWHQLSGAWAQDLEDIAISSEYA